MYKVFINESLLILRAKSANESSTEPEIQALHKWVERQCCSTAGSVWEVAFTDVEKAWQDFKLPYEWVDAAGGLVLDAAGNLLMIHRLGRWDLPKGKAEPGESIEETALREVEEECGISQIRLREKWLDSFHMYDRGGKRHLKQTHWYLMDHPELKPSLVAQSEEDIEKAVWCSREEVQQNLADSYGNIRLLFENDPWRA